MAFGGFCLGHLILRRFYVGLSSAFENMDNKKHSGKKLHLGLQVFVVNKLALWRVSGCMDRVDGQLHALQWCYIDSGQ